MKAILIKYCQDQICQKVVGKCLILNFIKLQFPYISSTYTKQALQLVIITRGKKCVWFISKITYINKSSENVMTFVTLKHM